MIGGSLLDRLSQETAYLLGSAALGLAVAWLAYASIALATRRRRLRGASDVYRWFEPLVDELAEWHRGRQEGLRRRVERLLVTAAQPPWKPEEFLAVRQVEGALVAAVSAAAIAGLCAMVGMPA